MAEHDTEEEALKRASNAPGWELLSRVCRRLASDSFYRSDQRSLQNVFVEILSDALQDARVG
jgi:hypothetical protein